MSGPLRSLRAGAAALRSALRPLLAVALLGALGGLAWALADEQEYVAAATVIAVDRGEPAVLAGAGVVGTGEGRARERLLELARGEEVAELAATALGGDLSGGDLRAGTSFRLDPEGGTLIVRATASFPDLAAAAANAFAGSVVEVGTVRERRRLSSAEERISDELAGLDPASERARRLSERLEAVTALQGLGAPLEVGAEAGLPADPQAARSPALGALGGAGLGALVGALVVLGLEARRRPIRTSEQFERALGGRVLATIGPGLPEHDSPEPAVVEPEEPGADRVQALAGALGLRRGGSAAQAIAVVSPMPGEGRTALALGLAAAAARRGARALLVEADLRAPTLAERLQIRPRPGLSDYLEGRAGPREVLRTVRVGAGREPAVRFVCVTAGSDGTHTAELFGPRYEKLVEQLRRVYDLVVFDTAPLLPAPEAAAVVAGLDGVLVCARAGRTRSSEVAAAVDRLGPVPILGGVLLGAPHRGPGLRRLPPSAPGSGARSAEGRRTAVAGRSDG